ncbi:MAG: histidine phosphatase family protein [Luminiphilus sp.]|nr:histidine phosphatase family protein [Luminiphilus sp.]
MLVTVWRHGEAGAASRDRDRTLTPRGTEALSNAVVRFQGMMLEKALPAVSGVVTSPWLRTRQTAELLGKALRVTPREEGWLAPSAGISDAARIFDLSDAHLLLISHQPLVSELLWYWLDSRALAPLAPGGRASLWITDHGQGQGTLVSSEVNI